MVEVSASPVTLFKPPYVQLGLGPVTTGANTSTLFGAAANYGYGSSGSLPLVRLEVGAEYAANLHGNYSLATTTPGTVTAILALGATTWTVDINNLIAGTPGAWWDAECDFACTAVSGTTATVSLCATITFQAAAGVTAAMTMPRGPTFSNKSVTTDANGFCTFDLRRTFTNAANTMQVDTLKLTRES